MYERVSVAELELSPLFIYKEIIHIHLPVWQPVQSEGSSTGP